ncbi:hypothetical protein LCGC14_2134100 [marine sediment metagenome]|uniref:Uncharacterized protein n=1 Tax=marine sediment metagenome TaxID=412755 RepID=A0A0F9E0L0_9ZZZZ
MRVPIINSRRGNPVFAVKAVGIYPKQVTIYHFPSSDGGIFTLYRIEGVSDRCIDRILAKWKRIGFRMSRMRNHYHIVKP